jgi:hypothetical protein
MPMEATSTASQNECNHIEKFGLCGSALSVISLASLEDTAHMPVEGRSSSSPGPDGDQRFRQRLVESA